MLSRSDMNPKLLSDWSHESLVSKSHHFLRHIWIQLQVHFLIQRTYGEQELDSSQMHSNAVPGACLERPLHEHHFCCWVLPTIRVERQRIWKDGWVSLCCVW